MPLSDLPGTEVWALSPDGKQSKFGLYVYLPPPYEKFEYPQLGMAVIRHMPDGNWVPWMAKKKSEGGKYNPRVFCYLDAIPQLIRALEDIRRGHTAGAKREDDSTHLMRRALDEAKADDDIDRFIRGSGEFK